MPIAGETNIKAIQRETLEEMGLDFLQENFRFVERTFFDDFFMDVFETIWRGTMLFLKILPFIVFLSSSLIMNYLIKKSEHKLSRVLFIDMASSIKLGKAAEKQSMRVLFFSLPIINAGSILGIIGVVYLLV